MKHSIELTIVGLIILCCACAAHCDETNKPPIINTAPIATMPVVPAVTNPTTLVVSDTHELKTDGPLSHFQLYANVVTQHVVIKREETIVTIVVSNTYTRAFSWTKDKGWSTNDALPSAIAPLLLSAETNVVNVPIQRQ